ncbi:MAG TPA: efflux RND transporter periplasmic adaptor subunit [Thermoanaerobaculia bacterium]|nr:efflux RND transporter periplasmic adaptor subunit [Thermoanaerobaculia bacterium]
MKRILQISMCVLMLAALAVGSGACSGSAADEGGDGDAAAQSDDDGDEQQARRDRRNGGGEDEEGEEREEQAVPVEVVALERGPIEAVLRFSTNLEAEEAVGVFSQASRQVQRLFAEEGDRVSKGQVLVRLQDEEQRNRVAKVKGQLARARREYDRQSRLFEQKLIAEQTFNDATYELEQLELELEDAERELAYTEVKAPIAGTITQRMVSVGDTVTVNQHLFDMVDFDSIVARVYVPEKELARLERGQPARIVAPALGRDNVYRGSVDRLSPIVDPRSGTVKVTVAIPRQQGLRPGMYVDVQLVTAVREDAVLVPKRALVFDDDQVFVYRMKQEGGEKRVERVYLVPALENETMIEPRDGIDAGASVVVAGQAGLKDGALVRLAGEPDPNAVEDDDAARGAE